MATLKESRWCMSCYQARVSTRLCATDLHPNRSTLDAMLRSLLIGKSVETLKAKIQSQHTLERHRIYDS